LNLFRRPGDSKISRIKTKVFAGLEGLATKKQLAEILVQP
jgi:hypothetical protein